MESLKNPGSEGDHQITSDKLTSIYTSVLELEDKLKVPGRKVLIIDDSSFTRITIRKILEKHDLFAPEDIIEAEDGITGLRKFKENLFKIDVVLCDIRMKGFDGLRFIKTVKDMERDLKLKGDIASFFQISITPVIAITGTAPGSKIEALEAGAKDFVMKPTREITLEEFERELVARIKNHITLKRSLEKLIETGENLYRTSIIDPLTGAFNRRYMKEIFDIEISRCMRKGTTLAVMVVDVDDFKKINDTYGHLIGDKVLIEISRRIFKTKRQYDYCVRYGGDEFVIILPETRKEGILSLYERLKNDLQENFISVEDESRSYNFPITISAGGTFFPSRSARMPEEILKVADKALYEAKRNGKCQIVIL